MVLFRQLQRRPVRDRRASGPMTIQLTIPTNRPRVVDGSILHHISYTVNDHVLLPAGFGRVRSILHCHTRGVVKRRGRNNGSHRGRKESLLVWNVRRDNVQRCFGSGLRLTRTTFTYRGCLQVGVEHGGTRREKGDDQLHEVSLVLEGTHSRHPGNGLRRRRGVAHCHRSVGIGHVNDVMVRIHRDDVIRSNALREVDIPLAAAGNAAVHTARAAAVAAARVVDALSIRIHVVVYAAAMAVAAALLLSSRVTATAARLSLLF